MGFPINFPPPPPIIMGFPYDIIYSFLCHFLLLVYVLKYSKSFVCYSHLYFFSMSFICYCSINYVMCSLPI
ncbi:hypothetical protein WDU94_003000 [Cyamophila willieti]